MRTETRQPKSRQAAAAAGMTKAQRVCQRLGSGAPRYELKTVSEAIQLAGAFYRQIREAMTIDGLQTDFGLQIAYMTLDFSVLFTRRYTPGNEQKLYEELSQEKGGVLMVGLIFGMKDPDDPKGRWLVGSKRFLDTPLVRMAIQQRVDSEDGGIS